MKRVVCVSAVLFALALSAVAQGRASGAVADQIKKLEQDRAQAVIKADTATLDRMTADDFSLIDIRGRLRTKQETLAAIKSGEIKIESMDLDDLVVHVYGNTAVITGKTTVKGTLGGQDVSGANRFTRVYTKQKGQWKAVAYQQTRIQE